MNKSTARRLLRKNIQKHPKYKERRNTLYDSKKDLFGSENVTRSSTKMNESEQKLISKLNFKNETKKFVD